MTLRRHERLADGERVPVGERGAHAVAAADAAQPVGQEARDLGSR
jgi:hypothetical protein